MKVLENMRLHISRPLLLLFSFLVIAAAIAVISLRTRIIDNIVATSTLIPATSTMAPSHRDLWNSRGSNNYEIIIEAVALPQPPVGVKLIIQNGEISNRSIIACDNPSAEYPTRLCEPIRQYYSSVGDYTIEELFDVADTCLNRTRASISKCSSTKIDELNDFIGIDEMFNAVKACDIEFQFPDSFCVVKYDPYYGYPRDISSYYPYFEDGFSSINVKSFQITE